MAVAPIPPNLGGSSSGGVGAGYSSGGSGVPPTDEERRAWAARSQGNARANEQLQRAYQMKMQSQRQNKNKARAGAIGRHLGNRGV
jgi:hypothetical protein